MWLGQIMSKVALITGINGQDGSYLAELLLEKGYSVHGVKRRSSTKTHQRIEHLLDHSAGFDRGGRITLHHGDMTDSSSLARIFNMVKPDEIYNLAAQSHVAVSFEEPEYTANADGLGVLRLLELIRNCERPVRLYQASTSELFGGRGEKFYDEKSPLEPRSPYSAAKAYAYYLIQQYREAYGVFAVNGILFNHESPRRGENFVTRKISIGVAKICLGQQRTITLGNLDAKRDWGHAKDYVRAMWAMMQLDSPDDFVVSTGQSWTVRSFVEKAFAVLGVKIRFEGSGSDECGYIDSVDDSNKLDGVCGLEVGQKVVTLSKSLYRPLEVDNLRGNPSKAAERLQWMPSIGFDELVSEMVISDFEEQKKFSSRCA